MIILLMKNYILLKPPEQVFKSKYAICYDLIELERQLFEKYNYEIKTFFSYQNLPIEENPTHTYLIFKEDSKYYWFEISWQSYKSIQGPFNSYLDCVKYVNNKLKESWKSKTIYTLEYKKFNYSNMNINQFGNYILKNGIKV